MNILQKADQITSGDRHNSYGHPGRDFLRVSQLWSAFLGVEIKPEHVPIMMVLLKISREANKHKIDNLIDGAGYFRTLEMLLYENDDLIDRARYDGAMMIYENANKKKRKRAHLRRPSHKK